METGPTQRGGAHLIGSARLSSRTDLLWAGSATVAALLAGAVAARSALLAGALALLIGLALVWVLMGPETIVVGALLTAAGFVPFVNPDALLPGGIALWTLMFALAFGIVAVTLLARLATGADQPRFETSTLLALVVVLLVYSWFRLAIAEPLGSPSTTARFATLAPAALLSYVMLSQPAAIAGLRRALPLAIGVLVLWALAYVAGASGQCPGCIDLVVSGSERPGLLGSSSRLYTAGQESFNAFAIVAFAFATLRTTPLSVGVAALAILNVALQASRAQYLAFALALLVVLAWRFRASRPSARIALVGAVGVAVVAIAVSAVGDRALSGYQELRSSTGNAGYRLQLIEQQRQQWSIAGNGVDSGAATAGFDFDLGLPNTLLALGLIGAALQMLVLLAGIGRALRFGGLVGVSLGAVLVYVLAGRPSLPLLEYGPSALVYGLVIGAVCALPVRGRSFPETRQEPR